MSNTTSMTIPVAYGASARIDASGSDLAVLVDIIDDRNVFYHVKDSTTAPTDDPYVGHLVPVVEGLRGFKRGRLSIMLKDGESLFLAARGAAAAAVYTTGVA